MALTNEQKQQLIELSQLYTFSNGLLILPPTPLVKDNEKLITSDKINTGNFALTTPAPVSLYPTPFPKDLFENSYNIQTIFNKMVDTISLDHQFLMNILEPLTKVDDFLKNLIEIYQQVREHNNENSNKRMGIFRSDYLLHFDGEVSNINNINEIIEFYQNNKQKFHLYQVELNTIASSFATLSSKTTGLHNFLNNYTNNYFNLFNNKGEIPDNKALSSIVDGLAKAHNTYNVKDSFILFVVQPNERNLFDQRHIELELFEKYNIKVIRKTLTELSKEAKLNEEDNNKLKINNNEISVVYYRSGYSPDDYFGNSEWNARKVLESSYAFKCPNLAYQLVGSKKIQQVLADKDILKRFIKEDHDLSSIHQSFTGLYSLDDTLAYEQLLKNPNSFVMKPSREGGGNNYYGKEIITHLNSISLEERKAYILMDRIVPPKFLNNNLGLRFGLPALKGNFISELGIYGIYLPDVLNEVSGHLLRTKLDSSNEGGVAVGHSVIDTPYLV